MSISSDTRLWGSFAWRFLHAISFTYPEQPSAAEQKNYREFFQSLAPVLPCKVCSVHFSTFMQNNPIQLQNRDALAKWVYDAHSNVNRMSHKPNPTFDEVKTAYTRMPPTHVLLLPEAQQAEYMKSEHVDAVLDANQGGTKTSLIITIVLIVLAVALLALLCYKLWYDSQKTTKRT